MRGLRGDARIVANDRLRAIDGLHCLLVPREAIPAALQAEEAVILGARADVPHDAKAAVVPVSIRRLPPEQFYGLTAWFRRDMVAAIRVREAVASDDLEHETRASKWPLRASRAAGNGQLIGFASGAAMPIARPEDRLQIRRELQRAERLGQTSDGKSILLFDRSPDSAVLRELGRLRETAFRRVGEGTGKRRDIDRFDAYYRHVIVWDDDDLQIVGAYRVGEVARIIATRGEQDLYTYGLFEYTDALRARFDKALELGRSFVQPRYYGNRAERRWPPTSGVTPSCD